MIGYITLGTNDLQRAGQFYDELLAEIGGKRAMNDESYLEGQISNVKIYNKALSLGATDEGAPIDRGSSMGFYGGYFRDLDGNKLVAYCLGWQAD